MVGVMAKKEGSLFPPVATAVASAVKTGDPARDALDSLGGVEEAALLLEEELGLPGAGDGDRDRSGADCCVEIGGRSGTETVCQE